jgi:hypothetical protein
MDIEKLKSAIQQVMPEVIEEWNTVKLPLFEALVEQKFEKYFEGRQTQEKTKMVAPILDSIFARRMNIILPDFLVDEGKGQDFSYGKVKIENKITFGEGDSWTGNGYKKTAWHLLMRFLVQNDGIISNKFVMMADMDKCKSSWTAPGTTSNFSTLKFVSEDNKKLIPIIGSISTSTRTGKPGTYIRPIMV